MPSDKPNGTGRNGAKLTWAVGADGETKHISEAENGLKCGCVCPICGAALIAKQGNVVAHHFTHASGDECQHAVETALHLAAKDILAVRKEIVLPAVEAHFPPFVAAHRDRAATALFNRVRGSGAETRFDHPGLDHSNQRARTPRRSDRNTRCGRGQVEKNKRTWRVMRRDRLGRRRARTRSRGT